MLMGRAKERLASRNPQSTVLSLEDFGLRTESGDGKNALKGLFKVEHIVKELEELKAVIQQSEKDNKDPTIYLKNYVFLGNPGTGKTTVARAMAEILHDIGILSSPNVKSCSALDLQAPYVGQTKDRVNEAMKEAQGGVLFIDEAYTLGMSQRTGGTVFAKEAVDQLVQLMTEPE